MVAEERDHVILKADRDRLVDEHRALRDILLKSQVAAEQAELESLELARVGRDLVEASDRLRAKTDILERDGAAIRAHRDILAHRVVTLERRQRIAKWLVGAFVAFGVAAASYRLLG